MEFTTGAILRHITHTDLSTAAHKLATLILDGIAWKDGYNGLPHGTAAFTLTELAERMKISRQHLHTLLDELAASSLRLIRRRTRGRLAAWFFRFGCCDRARDHRKMSTTDDTSPYIEDSNKNVFFGTIMLNRSQASPPDRWLELIRSAKATLPCRGTDSRHIWDRFREFNRRQGWDAVPAGYLLGFMRKWQQCFTSPPDVKTPPSVPSAPQKNVEAQALISAAPLSNRAFHENDLTRMIGLHAYHDRVKAAKVKFRCGEFQGKLIVHGMAVRAGEISR